MVCHVFCLFFEQLGWCKDPPGLGAQRKQNTLHISTVHIAQTGPQGHFSVGPQRGRGLSNPPTPTPQPLFGKLPLNTPLISTIGIIEVSVFYMFCYLKKK